MSLKEELNNKIALVTGASRGIGRGIALALGKENAIVIGTATTEAGSNKITEIFQSENIRGRGMVLDVALLSSIEQLIAAIKAEYKSAVSILINNAAITQDNLILRMKEDEWADVINTNLTSVYRMTKACIRDMVKARWGRIIQIGSIVGSTGNLGQANYAAAKAGLIGFTKSVALEVGTRGVTANVIAPGFIETDMLQTLSVEQKEMLMSKIAMQRPGTVADIAGVVLFLISKAADYITGQTLHVNGGMYMN